MEMLYVAYGLQLAASFPLPGMRAGERQSAALPRLTLALQSPEELDGSWSGTSGPAEWSGRQGDGRDLVIERGSAEDLLFTYGELARFRLSPDMSQLECAPQDSGLDWQRTLISKVIPSISVMLGYEALHAASVDSPQGVVALMAPSGAGKSTLALELLSRGWPLFADDELTLAEGDGAPQAYPGTPHMNVAETLPGGLDADALGTTLAVLAGERWLAVRSVSQLPRPVRMLCVLERAPDLALEAHTLPANPLLLAPYMLGLSVEPERQRKRFGLYADLMESATLVRLTAGMEHRPAQLGDLIEQALASQPELIAGAS
jgi:hypothetical protein